MNFFNLNIDDTYFTNIIETLSELKSLNFLSFSYNNIQRIDFIELLFNLKKIKYLDFSHNSLQTIDKKKRLGISSRDKEQITLPDKIELLDFSFNHLNNFSEILKILKILSSKNSNNIPVFRMERLFYINILGNPFSNKILSFLSDNSINTLNFILNENFLKNIINHTFDSANLIAKKPSSKEIKAIHTMIIENDMNRYFQMMKVNLKYLRIIDCIIEEIEKIINLQNYSAFEFDINSDAYEKSQETNLKINNLIDNPNLLRVNGNSNTFKYSVIEDLKTFNLFYATYSFTQRYQNFNDKLIFIEKVEKDDSTKVLLLSKQKLKIIPIIHMTDETNISSLCSPVDNILNLKTDEDNINQSLLYSPHSIDKGSCKNSKFLNSNKNKNNKKTENNYFPTKLTNLKIIYLNSNRLTNYINLEQFSEITELYLQSNKLKSLPNIELKFLKKLDVSNNYLKSLAGISNMKNLNYLLLENNNIYSLLLNEILLLTQLKEFNISGNRIDSLKECINLKQISNLQNLDLSGNGVSNFSDFRIFLIYNISNLKVLNRFAVEKNETLQAKEFFDGRITSELLESKIGHSQSKNVRELNLSNNKLKSFENIFSNDNFPNLKKLDLSRNFFSSFKIFSHLPSLNHLYLNSNIFQFLIDPKDRNLCTKGLLGIMVSNI